ncbi:MAG: alpha/beta fold hydrolase, partial [Anaerolineae bacterium]|nr:alpha/beta fold hydrolase [Anaerolineae bacterium]
ILNHAGFVDSRMWDEQWTELAKQYRVIRYDMVGYGKSPVVKAPRTRRNDLKALMDQLKVERVHLVGCSLGGEIVLDFELEHPDRVISLTLVSAVPGGFEMQGEPPAELMEMMGAVQQGDLQRVSELQVRLWVDGPLRQPEQVKPQVRELAAMMNKIAVENGTFAVIDAEPLNPLNPPAAGRIHEVKVPTLIIAGALDNSEIVRAAAVMAAEIKDAQQVILPDAAHVPNMEQPEIFNQAVLNFLRDIK